MSTCINTEAIYTHLDEFAVAFDEVISHKCVLGVEVHAVACYLSPPTGIVVPVEVAIVVPVVILIVVLTVGILHFGQTLAILFAAS